MHHASCTLTATRLGTLLFMTPLPSPVLLEALHWRYATKMFDPVKKIPAETWAALEQSLVLTPSSFGL